MWAHITFYNALAIAPQRHKWNDDDDEDQTTWERNERKQHENCQSIKCELKASRCQKTRKKIGAALVMIR